MIFEHTLLLALGSLAAIGLFGTITFLRRHRPLRFLLLGLAALATFLPSHARQSLLEGFLAGMVLVFLCFLISAAFQLLLHIEILRYRKRLKNL